MWLKDQFSKSGVLWCGPHDLFYWLFFWLNIFLQRLTPKPMRNPMKAAEETAKGFDSRMQRSFTTHSSASTRPALQKVKPLNPICPNSVYRWGGGLKRSKEAPQISLIRPAVRVISHRQHDQTLELLKSKRKAIQI